MTNQITLNHKTFISLRRIVSLVAFWVLCICPCLMLFGFIPFWGRSFNLMASINTFFEILNIGTKSFWYCAACVAFSIFYVLITIKMIVVVVKRLKTIKKWLGSDEDNHDTRRYTRILIESANTSVWQLLLLYVVSYALHAFTVRGRSLLIIIGLLVVSVFVNAMKDIIFKGDIWSGVVHAVNNGMILALMVMFAVFSTNVQVLDVFKALKSVMFAISTEDIQGTFVLQLIIHQAFIPIVNIIMLISIMCINAKIVEYSVIEAGMAKGILIRNSIFLGIIVVSLGYVSGYSSVPDYLGLIFKNIMLVISTAIIFIVDINTAKLPPDVAYIEKETANKEQEPTEVEAPVEEAPIDEAPVEEAMPEDTDAQ